MLCPQCGVNVGDSISLCANCVKARGMKDQSADRLTSDKSPQNTPRARRCNTAELNQLYRQTLGVTTSEQMLAFLSRPATAAVLAILGYVILLGMLLVSFPKLPWYVSALMSVSATGLLIYLALYLTILLDLFYLDRFAFFVCLLGLMSIPGVAFLYREEIGNRKLFTACAGWVIALVFAVSASALSMGQAEAAGIFLPFQSHATLTVHYADGTQQTFDQ
jgi:hypothetical protein